jgi:hypothetical protein
MATCKAVIAVLLPAMYISSAYVFKEKNILQFNIDFASLAPELLLKSTTHITNLLSLDQDQMNWLMVHVNWLFVIR